MVGSQSMLVSGANAVLSHRVQTPCEVFISKPCTCQRKVWRSLPWRVWKIFGYLTCRFCSGYHLANVQNMLASARELIDTAITCIYITLYNLKARCWQFNHQAFFQLYPTSIVPIHKKNPEGASILREDVDDRWSDSHGEAGSPNGWWGWQSAGWAATKTSVACWCKGFKMSKDGITEILELCERMGMWLNLVPFMISLSLAHLGQ